MLTDEQKEISQNLRQQLVELILLLSSEHEQKKYAELVGDSTAIAEMICMWFDDQYHPNSEIFRYGFSTDELNSLEKLNDYYDQIDRDIPEHDLSELLANTKWQQLMSIAKSTYEQLSPNNAT